MGRKKPSGKEEERPAAAAAAAAAQGGGKSKKKSRVIDDDEYSIGADLGNHEEEAEAEADAEAAVPIGGKKKGKKGGGSKAAAAAAAEQEEEDEEEEAPPSQIAFAGKKKSKSKASSGKSLFSASNFDVLDDDQQDGQDEDEEEDREVVASKGNSVFSSSAFDSIGADDDDDEHEKEEEEGEEEEEPVIAFTGKKKSSKSSKKGGKMVDEGDDDNEPIEEDEDASSIVITGKKKKKKSKSSVAKNSFFADALLDEDDGGDEPMVADDIGIDDDDDDEDVAPITFSGKKKPSKSKKTNDAASVASTSVIGMEDEDGGATAEIEQSYGDGDNAVDAKSSKNKKKKKKNGRTAQEEDDLDKILAELGEGLSVPKPTVPPQAEEKAQQQPEPVAPADAAGEEKEGEAEGVESAAAKKKKKKKDKEKEKKAAAAAVQEEKQEESKSKVGDKKVSKRVREMQEALARQKEAEERRKREEEEKLRKEEEERRRLEELERQAEEAKQRKKQKEKEKIMRKKMEGTYLTGKQKEEARRREAMRNQFSQNGSFPIGDTASAPGKRPIYQTKKSRQANGAGQSKSPKDIEEMENHEEVVDEVNVAEVEKVEEVEPEVKEADRESVVEPVVEEENGMAEDAEEEEDDDGDWDAKSWDDAVIDLGVKSAFADEEVENVAEPVPVVRKEIKRVTAPASVQPEVSANEGTSATTTKKKDAPPPPSQVESKEKRHESENMEMNRGKEAAGKRGTKKGDTQAKKNADNLRSPICCIMGHVDTGKTKLLDCIRGTNVQEGEAGGITQQIGATYFPAENIRERTKELKADATLRVPGLLVIDTPGHESFTNLRSRGSGLCDIAILVVDIMHGLEQQTIESLNLLKMRNTEFIVALNKVDRLYGWKTCPNAPIVKAMKQQTNDVQNEFKMRLTQIITQFKEQGLNTELYYKNKEMGETFSIVPTSAISGEGIPDLLLLLVQWTQKTMVEKLMFREEVECTVLEVKVIEGLGTTIDVVLVNGVLHEGDQIVVCGMQGPIVTTIRALLTPHPMKELRVKGSYLHHKELKAAQGIKITAQGLEHAIAGTGLYVVGPDDDLEDVKESTMQDMKSVMSRIDKSGEGVCVQASTLGSLEALLEFLKSPAVKIPVSGISIGPVHKRDVMKASVMLERKKEYAAILAFDVKVTPEARELADETGVKIFIADIIYHLFDQFKAYIDNLKEERKKESADEAVFPCVLKIMPNCVFNKKDPIILGVDVLEGIAKVGTPICIPSREFIDIGRIASIEINHKQVDVAKKGSKVAIKIISTSAEDQQKMYGRHFDIEDELVSHITRSSIDVLKANYREDLTNEEWKLVVKLKNLLKIL
ncbi:hypothetical protein Syun_015262 [Stephania yunnanensis]|uniref:Eukaryotic translation initiation factor 5B n=1 Tax=Stephania yunnanensis TaxID=152371 RepID=A0AAP0JN68_9MAGN